METDISEVLGPEDGPSWTEPEPPRPVPLPLGRDPYADARRILVRGAARQRSYESRLRRRRWLEQLFRDGAEALQLCMLAGSARLAAWTRWTAMRLVLLGLLFALSLALGACLGRCQVFASAISVLTGVC